MTRIRTRRTLSVMDNNEWFDTCATTPEEALRQFAAHKSWQWTPGGWVSEDKRFPMQLEYTVAYRQFRNVPEAGKPDGHWIEIQADRAGMIGPRGVH